MKCEDCDSPLAAGLVDIAGLAQHLGNGESRWPKTLVDDVVAHRQMSLARVRRANCALRHSRRSILPNFGTMNASLLM
jgi:hypothetical protein